MPGFVQPNCQSGGAGITGLPRDRPMRILVGVDVQPIDEVEASITQFGVRYTNRLFTEQELQSCGGSARSTANGLAARFAAKEAVMKILDSRGTYPSWKEIEVIRGEDSRPQVVLWGQAQLIARRQRIKQMSLSLSHAGGIATAAVVAQTSLRRSKGTR